MIHCAKKFNLKGGKYEIHGMQDSHCKHTTHNEQCILQGTHDALFFLNFPSCLARCWIIMCKTYTLLHIFLSILPVVLRMLILNNLVHHIFHPQTEQTTNSGSHYHNSKYAHSLMTFHSSNYTRKFYCNSFKKQAFALQFESVFH